MNDLLGKALLDFYFGKDPEILYTETNISEQDELPLPYLFRTYAEMPLLEQVALKACKGKVLDVGCGAGSHSLYLQQQGFEVKAIDTSEGAVPVSKQRGVANVQQTDLLSLSEEKFDTILLLMNGTGIFQTVENVPKYLQHLRSLLATHGKVLIDSSDLRYMYDPGEEGGIWVPADRYYGELEFTILYKGEQSEPFDWLYMDENLFKELSEAAGFQFSILARGDNFDYLAQLTLDHN